MHIPDGFLSPPVWATLDILGVPAIGLLARRAQRQIEEKQIPLLGVMGAFIFAAQMINFPVGIGTSSHLVGGALLAYTLGPAAASLVLTAILMIQSLVFQDGGILALGANVLNMAVIGVWAAYLPYHWLRDTKYRTAGIFGGAALSLLASAVCALAELLLSGVPMPGAVILVSLGVFLVSALLEGAITVAVLQAIERINPVWVRTRSHAHPATLSLLAVSAVLLAAIGVLFASTHPDGLEKLIEQLGLANQHRTVLPATPLADYEWNGISSSPWLRKASAGLAGLGLITLVCITLGRMAAARRRSA